MPAPWSIDFDAECTELVARVCATGDSRPRDQAWRELLIRIAPRLEGWARTSPLLRQCGLANEDDARSVLVAVFERLAAHDFENLRQYLARAPKQAIAPSRDVDDLELVARLDDGRRDDADDVRHTPLRAWLLRLLQFVERDHVRARLGWGTGDKRVVGTGADRLPTDGEPLSGVRPPITDALTIARLASDIRDEMAQFPAPMRNAIELWMHDASFDEIAETLALRDENAARALVRAGQARLRERFREQFPALLGK